VLGTLESLDEEALVRILTEPKNAITKQYAKFLEMEGVKLDFTEDALRAISTLAIQRGTGARGLRAVIEEAMLEVMYDIPSRSDVIAARSRRSASRTTRRRSSRSAASARSVARKPDRNRGRPPRKRGDVTGPAAFATGRILSRRDPIGHESETQSARGPRRGEEEVGGREGGARGARGHAAPRAR